MRTLWLLRHGKAGPGSSSTDDHDRPLEASGRDAARRVGRFLAGRGLAPDRVLCSTALRTRQTLDELGSALPEAPPSELARELYLASAGELFGSVQGAPDSARRLMLIGHNPGMSELAIMLSARGDATLRQQLRLGFPTCALAELCLDAPSWADLSQGCELVGFTLPRDLPAVS